MKLPRLKNDKLPEIRLNRLQIEMKKNIDQKVKKAVYQFEKIKCPICLVDDSELIGEKDRYGLYFPTNICVSCGLIYTSPRMNQQSYGEFYNNEYRKLYGGSDKPTNHFFLEQKWRGKQIYSFLENVENFNPESLFVLEVGCGAGGILGFFKEKGAEVLGIDLGEEYIEYGKQIHNLNLFTGALNEIEIKKKPDLIIYSHCLEHILDVSNEIELIKKISKKETIIYIEIPGVKNIHINYDMNILKYFQNAHTFHFTLETLSNLMGKSGFKLLAGNQKVQSAFVLDNKNINKNNDYNNVVNYIELIERKRKYYSFTLLGISKNLKKTVIKFLYFTKTMELARSVLSSISKKK
jgi:2-polyprenyl-3-methyl-5-hydroxy-6-metoxy-1,4-benzoquinol methylase